MSVGSVDGARDRLIGRKKAAAAQLESFYAHLTTDATTSSATNERVVKTRDPFKIRGSDQALQVPYDVLLICFLGCWKSVKEYYLHSVFVLLY